MYINLSKWLKQFFNQFTPNFKNTMTSNGTVVIVKLENYKNNIIAID